MAAEEQIECVQEWIEQLLNYQFERDFFKELRNGVILCELLNKIQPGTCHKYVKSKYGYIHKRNIDIYLSGCRSLGIDKSSCFISKDLINGINLDKIINNLISLNNAAKTLQHFNGPFIINSSQNQILRIRSITNIELTELQTATSLYKLILIWIKHVQINNFKSSSYWKSFKKCFRSHLQLITDIDKVEKLLNSAYIVRVKKKKEYCTILEILGHHLFTNCKIEACIDEYNDIYRNQRETDLKTLNSFNGYKSCEIIWEIISTLVLENGANPFIFVEYNKQSKIVKSTQSFKSIQNYYNALNIMYIKGVITENIIIDRFLYILQFAKTSWRDSIKPKPSILTRCRFSNRYYFFGDAISSILNPMILPKIAMKLLLMGYDIYNECKCNNNPIQINNKYHDYSYKYIIGQQEYLQFTSNLNNYQCADNKQHSYFIDFLFYIKYAEHSNSLDYFNDNKWIYRILKRLPLLNRDWLIFIGNMVYPKIIDNVEMFLSENDILSNENDEYFTIWNAWIDLNYKLNYVARLIPFAGLIYGEQMKKLIRHYIYYTTPYLQHILNTNYQFSLCWNGSLLFEILSDKKIPKKNIIFIINHIHSIYADIYESEQLYRTIEIYDLVFHFNWDHQQNIINKNMLLLFKNNKYFKYAINSHFHQLCDKSFEQKLSFFLNNKILSIKYCADIDGLIYYRLTYLIINFNQQNTYSIGRIFHWIIHEYTKSDNVRVKNIVHHQILAVLRNNNIKIAAENNKLIQQHCNNLIKLTM